MAPAASHHARTSVGRVNIGGPRARRLAGRRRPGSVDRRDLRLDRHARSGWCSRGRAVLASVRGLARAGSAARAAGCSRCPRRTSRACRSICRSLVAGHEPVLLEEHASFAGGRRGTPTSSRWCRPSCTGCSTTDADALRDLPHRAARRRTDRPRRCAVAPRTPACGWWRRTAPRRPPAAASTTATRSTGWRSPSTADGRIRIGGPTLFDGYDGDPALTAEVLVDGWFLTSDAGRLDEDGRLHVLGRVDDVVVSGGVNVPAPAVAARLREHPAVDGGRGARRTRRGVGQPARRLRRRRAVARRGPGLGRRGAPAVVGAAAARRARRDPAAAQRQARPDRACGELA